MPEGTKLWKNKVLGLRGKATGLVFSIFDKEQHTITKEEAEKLVSTSRKKTGEHFETFTAGVDTSYSNKTADTIALVFGGLTNKGRFIVLDCKEYNNRDLSEPLAPTDTVKNLIDFLDRNKKDWGLARHVFVDSADQATLTELRKWKRANPQSMYLFENSYKKLRNIDRIELQLGWFGQGVFFVLDTCTPYLRELSVYSWDESKDSTPEDGNDHCIQACQYAWLPYKDKIGKQ